MGVPAIRRLEDDRHRLRCDLADAHKTISILRERRLAEGLAVLEAERAARDDMAATRRGFTPWIFPELAIAGACYDRPAMMMLPGNVGGSVEHFYHFMFGYLLPFIEHCQGMRDTHYFLFRSCGPMDRLLPELDGFSITTVPVHLMLRSVVGSVPISAAIAPRMTVPGFDSPHIYERTRFMRIRRIMHDMYGRHIAAAAARYPASSSERLVVVVDRAPSHPFYLSGEAEIPQSGAHRRSVPNMTDVFDAVAARHRDALFVRLEELALFEQIHLFSRAWRVVAQHGAGLAHMLWAQPAAKLVEIRSDATAQQGVSGACFSDLCEMLGIGWHGVLQETDHAPVVPGDILAALD